MKPKKGLLNLVKMTINSKLHTLPRYISRTTQLHKKRESKSIFKQSRADFTSEFILLSNLMPCQG